MLHSCMKRGHKSGLASKGARSRAHFSTHLKYILGALLLRTLNITTTHLVLGLKKN